MMNYDIVIIGGGPAGLAAAIAAHDAGDTNILILERDKELGGILNQCIHNGFGLHTFNEELTGPEYAQRYISQVLDKQIEYKTNTMVIEVSQDKIITAMNRSEGMFQIKAKAIVLAMGCRERSRGALNIPGYRPAGIYSAGTAQRLVNIEGFMPGRKVVILGSGDIGLIMARRMTLEGAKVKVVAELLPYSGGLTRNIVQCLEDFNIPLKLRHTVIDIKGKERVEGVTIAEVDEHNKPIKGTEEYYECDTLLLSCGLIPENEISRGMNVDISNITNGPTVNESMETNIAGVFACGNVLHVHDLVDYVSEEASFAGENAAIYALSNKEEKTTRKELPIVCNAPIRYTVPIKIDPQYMQDALTIRFRVGRIVKNRYVNVYLDDNRIIHKKRPIMKPGEMEDFVLKKSILSKHVNANQISVKIEEE